MDDTASLSTQFAISVSNPIQAGAGYLLSPYSSLYYPDIGALSADGVYSQWTASIWRDSDLRLQHTASISDESPLKCSFFEIIDRRKHTGCQWWFTPFNEKPVNSQVFVQLPFIVVGDGDYCKVPWPSYAWPFIHVFGSLTRTQTTVMIKAKPGYNFQVDISPAKRNRLMGQIFIALENDSALNTSFYMPCVLEIYHGRPQYNFQVDMQKMSILYNEVRWRPY